MNINHLQQKSSKRFFTSFCIVATFLLSSNISLAQIPERPFSADINVGSGLMSFPGLCGGVSSYHTADIFADGYFNFRPHWSLFLGAGYQYRFVYVFDDILCKSTSSSNEKHLVDCHYGNILFGLEYSHKWFFLKVGGKVDIAFEPWVAANTYEVCELGGFVQPGGKIRLTDNSCLRIGWQFLYGRERVKQKEWEYGMYEDRLGATKSHHKIISTMIVAGYEYHF